MFTKKRVFMSSCTPAGTWSVNTIPFNVKTTLLRRYSFWSLTNIKSATFQTSVETRFSAEQENPGKRMFSYTFQKSGEMTVRVWLCLACKPNKQICSRRFSCFSKTMVITRPRWAAWDWSFKTLRVITWRDNSIVSLFQDKTRKIIFTL